MHRHSFHMAVTHQDDQAVLPYIQIMALNITGLADSAQYTLIILGVCYELWVVYAWYISRTTLT
jgi:hypothetical protein